MGTGCFLRFAALPLCQDSHKASKRKSPLMKLALRSAMSRGQHGVARMLLWFARAVRGAAGAGDGLLGAGDEARQACRLAFGCLGYVNSVDGVTGPLSPCLRQCNFSKAALSLELSIGN